MPAGQWGFTCLATGGEAQNPACDSAQGFKCYGQNPSDGAAFCTIFDCKDDTDCRGGWACATVNAAPNVTTDVRSPIGMTRKVCLPRGYCDACTSDIDCPTVSGRVQRCVADTAGAKFCSSTCTSDSNCASEARCTGGGGSGGTSDGGSGDLFCFPRAGTCVGDGSVCAPCHSDADCPKGACIKSDFSTERSCTVQSKVPCSIAGGGALVSDCPPLILREQTDAMLSCEVLPMSHLIPQNQCFGYIQFADGVQPGCYTPKR
jgi:hypothetical protein